MFNEGSTVFSEVEERLFDIASRRGSMCRDRGSSSVLHSEWMRGRRGQCLSRDALRPLYALLMDKTDQGC